MLLSIDVNATFKHDKTVMAKRSWHPEQQITGDAVYWLNNNRYQKLDARSWSDIVAAKAKL